jgi:hypothetical protein
MNRGHLKQALSGSRPRLIDSPRKTKRLCLEMQGSMRRVNQTMPAQTITTRPVVGRATYSGPLHIRQWRSGFCFVSKTAATSQGAGDIATECRDHHEYNSYFTHDRFLLRVCPTTVKIIAAQRSQSPKSRKAFSQPLNSPGFWPDYTASLSFSNAAGIGIAGVAGEKIGRVAIFVGIEYRFERAGTYSRRQRSVSLPPPPSN